MSLVAIPAMPVAARAASLESKERAARTACLAGDYAKGVALLAEVYVSTMNEVYIFNQGRCFEQNGMYEKAIVRFREYQRKSLDAGRTPHPRAEEHIADCQKWLDKLKSPTPASAQSSGGQVSEAAPPPVVLPVVPAAPAPPTRSAPVDLSPRVSSPSPGSVGPPTTSTPVDLLRQPEASSDGHVSEGHPFYKAWWFWTTVGAAVVAGSITAFLLTRRAPDACDDLGMRCVEVTGL